MQVQVVNTGNTILQGIQVSEANITSLVCKSGASTALDTAVSTAFTASDPVPHGHKLVCLGTYTFTQEELDLDQNSKAFTPALTSTTTPAVQRETSGYDTGYGASATVAISAVPALVVSVNATACSIPSIIPADAQSKPLSPAPFVLLSLCYHAALQGHNSG
jgi:hypothetical protein